MKIAIIVLYFGRFPSYYQLFLDSCKINEQYEWYIYGDDTSEYIYPPNVHFINMTFEECKKLIQSKFLFKINLEIPQKLCDYKCAYGYIFESFFYEYDWWGHCDLDQIFGNLEHFITREMLDRYDKLFSMGHLTLYRNTYKNNRIFMEEFCGRTRYKEVFTTEKACGFDEWLPGNVNELYINNKIPVMLDNMGADVNPYKTQFVITRYSMEQNCYVCENVKNSIFCWNNGVLYQMYMKKGVLIEKEYPYVHLQKRKIRDDRSFIGNKYYIIPNKFVEESYEPWELIKKCKKYRILNIQYFKVKYKSFCYRIKQKDWKYQNVFKPGRRKNER